MLTHKLTAEILSAAIEGFESQKRRIDTQIAEIRQMLEGGPTEPTAAPPVPKVKQRKMSAAARKRMGDAQRKRWAESKGQFASPSAATAKPKRKMSAAGRRAIVAALKKRWAEKKAAAAKTEPATSNKVVANRSAVKKASAKKAAKGSQ